VIEKFHMMTHLQMFGMAVTKLRQNIHLDQDELARRSGVTRAKLARIEGGTASPDSFGLREICKLTSAMRTTPYHLMKEYEKLVKAAGEAWW
jgi:transcriptional regulator with XRE-family HTH domain